MRLQSAWSFVYYRNYERGEVSDGQAESCGLNCLTRRNCQEPTFISPSPKLYIKIELPFLFCCSSGILCRFRRGDFATPWSAQHLRLPSWGLSKDLHCQATILEVSSPTTTFLVHYSCVSWIRVYRSMRSDIRSSCVGLGATYLPIRSLCTLVPNSALLLAALTSSEPAYKTTTLQCQNEYNRRRRCGKGRCLL
jgi:hypothetical protein